MSNTPRHPAPSHGTSFPALAPLELAGNPIQLVDSLSHAHTFLSDSSAWVHVSLPSLEHAVHTFDSLTAVVDALGADALTAGIVEPAVLGGPHGLTGYLTLMYGHAVVKVHHCAHVLFVTGVRRVHVIAGNRHVLLVRLVHRF